MRRLRAAAVAAALLAGALPAGASAPDWVRAAGQTSVPASLLAGTPSPDAAILWRQQIVTAGQRKGSTKIFVREAVRVLTPAGISAGTFHAFYDDDSAVALEGAWTVHRGGGLDALKLRDVVTVQLADPEDFSDTYVLAFRPPALEPGDVAAYALSRKSHRDVYQWSLPLQDESPIVGEEVVIDLPEGWTHRWRLRGTPEGYSGPLTGGGGNRASYRFGPQRPCPDEPFGPPGQDRFAMLEVSATPPASSAPGFAFRDWDEVARWFNDVSRPARAPLVADPVPSGPGDPVAAPASWVQRSVRYVAVEVGEGGYVPRPPALVAQRRFGDCKDKAFLLLALLARRGREAFPVLTRPRSTGTIDPDFPSPIAFDHAVVAVRIPKESGLPAEVKLRDGPAVIFDPTDPSLPFGELPGGLQGARGLVVRPDGGELVEFPAAPAKLNRLTREVAGTIDAAGALTAAVRTVSRGALCERLRYRGTTPIERQERVARFAEREIPGSRAGEPSVQGLEDNSAPLETRFSVSASGFLRRTGGVRALPLLPFGVGPARLGHLDRRRFRIDLEFPRIEEYRAELTLPAGVSLEALPDPVRVENAYLRYRFSARAEGQRVIAEEVFEVREPVIPLADIAAWTAVEDAASEARATMAVLRGGL